MKVLFTGAIVKMFSAEEGLRESDSELYYIVYMQKN